MSSRSSSIRPDSSLSRGKYTNRGVSNIPDIRTRRTPKDGEEERPMRPKPLSIHTDFQSSSIPSSSLVTPTNLTSTVPRGDEGSLGVFTTPRLIDSAKRIHRAKIGGIQSSGIKGGARRIENATSLTAKSPSVRNLHAKTSALKISTGNIKRMSGIVTPSPRSNSKFNFDDVKISSATKIRAMTTAPTSLESKKTASRSLHQGAPIMNTLNDHSLKDIDRKLLSSGARRISRKANSSTPKKTGASVYERLSARPKSSLKTVDKSSSRDDNISRCNDEGLVEHFGKISLANEFQSEAMCYEQKNAKSEKIHSNVYQTLISSIGQSEDDIFLDEVLGSSSFHDDENLIGDETYETKASQGQELQIEHSAIQTNKDDSPNTSNTNESYDSITEHMPKITDKIRVVVESDDEDNHRDGSLNPMSRTLLEEDAEKKYFGGK